MGQDALNFTRWQTWLLKGLLTRPLKVGSGFGNTMKGTHNHQMGVSIVAHTASIMSLDPDPHKVIPDAIAFVVNALKASYGEPSVKRFVFTSSSAATVSSALDTPGIVVTEDTWNEDAVKKAWAEPPYGMDRAGAVYAASKTQAEQEVWKFHKENRENRPDLVVNTGKSDLHFEAVHLD